jgi:hypothetical protein
MNPKRIWIKTLRSQKELNGLKEEFNKLEMEPRKLYKKRDK